MKKHTELVLLDVNLKSFDGEGAAAPAGGGDGAAGTSGEGSVATTGTEQVIYGKVDSSNVDTQQQQEKGGEENIPPDRNAEFESMIKGDFKEQFDTRVQSIIDKRFKNNKQLEAQVGEMQPIVDLLNERYGTKSVQELFEKIESESIEELAYQANMTPEQFKRMRDLEKKANLYDKTITNQDQQRMMQEQVNSWREQAENMKADYPDFDLVEWSNNNEFLKLLNANVPVKQAYELLNLDNIKAGVAQQAQENTAKSIQSKKNRPKESATKTSGGVVVKSDVKSLTSKDRAEIAARVARGEEIRF